MVAGEDVRLFVFALVFLSLFFPHKSTHTHTYIPASLEYSPVMCIENTCVAPNPQDALLSSALCSVFMYQQFILLYIFLGGWDGNGEHSYYLKDKWMHQDDH